MAFESPTKTTDNDADVCFVWQNFANFGDDKPHLTPHKDIDLNGIAMDSFPQEVLDGFFCVGDSEEGRRNYIVLRDLLRKTRVVLVVTTYGQHPLLDHQELMRKLHPQQADKYISSLRAVRIMQIDEMFDEAITHWEKEYGELMGQ